MAHTTKFNKRQSTRLNGSKDGGIAAVTPLLLAQSSVQKYKSVSAQKSLSSSSSSLLSSSSLGVVAEKGSVCSSGNSSKQNSGRQKRQRTTRDGTQEGDGGNVAAKKKRRSAHTAAKSNLNNNASLSSTSIAAASSLLPPPPSPLSSPPCPSSSTSPSSSSEYENNDGANNNDKESTNEEFDFSALLTILDEVNLDEVKPEEAAELMKIGGAEIEFQLIAKYLLQQEKHSNATHSTMETHLRAIVAYHLGKITKEQERMITEQCRELHRIQFLENGQIFNGGELVAEINADGIKFLLHYSPPSAANNVGEDKCSRIPRSGPGSDIIISVTKTLVKSCIYEEELQTNPDAVWPTGTPDIVKEYGRRINVTDIWPGILPKGDGSSSDLKRNKDEFVNAMGFTSAVIDGRVVTGINFAEMIGMIQHIRNIVVMNKRTGRPVPTLAFGEVARKSVVNDGKFESTILLGCGGSHHPEGMLRASSKNKKNVKESDDNVGVCIGHLRPGSQPYLNTFGMRRLEKKYLNGEIKDIDVLKAKAAMYVYEQVHHFGRTKEEVLEAMPDELSVHHYLLYEACVRGGRVTDDKRTEAALFMVEQIYVNGLSEEAALDLMPDELSPAHRAIYEGCLKGRPVRLTSLDGNTVLATARSISAAARMLGIACETISTCFYDGVLKYFEEELCLIEEIKYEEGDEFGRTSAFNPWFSNLQLEKVKTQYNLQKAAAGKKGAKKGADTMTKMLSDAQQLENMFIQANLLQYRDNRGCRLLVQPLLSETHVNILLGPRHRPNHPPAEKTLVDISEEIGAKIGEAVGRIVSTRAHFTDEVGKSFGKKIGTDVGAAVGAQVEAEVKAKAFDGALAQIVSKVQTAVLAEVEQKVITAIRVAQEFQDLNKP